MFKLPPNAVVIPKSSLRAVTYLLELMQDPSTPESEKKDALEQAIRLLKRWEQV